MDNDHTIPGYRSLARGRLYENPVEIYRNAEQLHELIEICKWVPLNGEQAAQAIRRRAADVLLAPHSRGQTCFWLSFCQRELLTDISLGRYDSEIKRAWHRQHGPAEGFDARQRIEISHWTIDRDTYHTRVRAIAPEQRAVSLNTILDDEALGDRPCSLSFADIVIPLDDSGSDWRVEAVHHWRSPTGWITAPPEDAQYLRATLDLVLNKSSITRRLGDVHDARINRADATLAKLVRDVIP